MFSIFTYKNYTFGIFRKTKNHTVVANTILKVCDFVLRKDSTLNISLFTEFFIFLYFGGHLKKIKIQGGHLSPWFYLPTALHSGYSKVPFRVPWDRLHNKIFCYGHLNILMNE